MHTSSNNNCPAKYVIRMSTEAYLYTVLQRARIRQKRQTKHFEEHVKYLSFYYTLPNTILMEHRISITGSIDHKKCFWKSWDIWLGIVLTLAKVLRNIFKRWALEAKFGCLYFCILKFCICRFAHLYMILVLLLVMQLRQNSILIV